jgi:adenosylhomocysteine nucleosidase
MRILFVASDPLEFRGLLSHATGVHPLQLGVRWARAASACGGEVVLAANGVGWRWAAAAVDAAMASWKPDAIVSTGFCGGLDEELRIADIVVGTAIDSVERSWPAAPVSARLAFRTGTVSSVPYVARTVEQKRHLRTRGAVAVEMEAAGVAGRAESLGIPFYCVRAVTDLANETLANDFDRALRSDGHFATMHILREALRQPTVRLPELWRLRSRCIQAARSLGDFLADCRF